MTADALGAWATCLVGAVGLFQWFLTIRLQTRQRDKELFEWGSQVLYMMARVESACAPLTGDANPDLAMALANEASALVDQGRLFFPNTPDLTDPAGLRVRILDEVLRACYVAQHVAKEQKHDQHLRCLVWQARRRFITLLQAEMGSSLRKSKPIKAGARISKNPNSWG